MISHGFISGAMFFSIGVLYDRTHSRKIDDYGGVCNKMLNFFRIFCFFCISQLRVTGNKWICGGIFLILAAVKEDIVIGLFAALT